MRACVPEGPDFVKYITTHSIYIPHVVLVLEKKKEIMTTISPRLREKKVVVASTGGK